MGGMTRRLFLAAMAAAGIPAQAAAQDGPVVVYLVRHAEKADDSRDPPLSEAGRARAAELARVLGDAGLTQVWTTGFDRTRSTAAAAAAAAGLKPQLYDPSSARGFADQLRHTPGRHLVVGHSNTTPALVELLGGAPGSPIADTEYDRLYIVVLDGTRVVTSLLRYGAPASR